MNAIEPKKIKIKITRPVVKRAITFKQQVLNLFEQQRQLLERSNSYIKSNPGSTISFCLTINQWKQEELDLLESKIRQLPE